MEDKIVQDNRKLYKMYSFQYQCLKRCLGTCTRISIKVKRKRWRFLGHVLRMPREHHCATALTWTPMGKRKVGRPKTTWRCTMEKERTMAGWKSWEEVRPLANDRDKWKKSSAALCATEHKEDRWGEVTTAPSLFKSNTVISFLTWMCFNDS